jgi:hypothetical protein
MLFLIDSLISSKRKMQQYVTLSVAKAKLMALNACVQEMIHVKQLIELMNINVKLPITIEVDNKGAKDVVNNCSIGVRHSDKRLPAVNFNPLTPENFQMRYIPSELTNEIYSFF